LWSKLTLIDVGGDGVHCLLLILICWCNTQEEGEACAKKAWSTLMAFSVRQKSYSTSAPTGEEGKPCLRKKG